MLQVLNSKERNEAFLKFLLFFLVTTGLLVLGVFFNYKLPLKENKKLLEQLTIQGQLEMKQQLFVQHMAQAMALLDSMDKAPANKDRIVIELDGKFRNMDDLKSTKGSIYASFNEAVIKNLMDLKQQKLMLLKLADKTKYLADLEQKLRIFQADLEQRTRDIDLLRSR